MEGNNSKDGIAKTVLKLLMISFYFLELFHFYKRNIPVFLNMLLVFAEG